MDADGMDLVILTDVWSEPVARELMRRWPDRRLEVRYFRQDEVDRLSFRCSPTIKATCLNLDFSTIWLDDRTKFYYALCAHQWEMALLFHRKVLRKCTWARFIGRIYSFYRAEVLYLRNFHVTIEAWIILCLLARHMNSTVPGSKASIIVCLSSNPFGNWLVNYLIRIHAHIIVCAKPSYSRMIYLQGKTILRKTLKLIGQSAKGLQKQKELPAKQRLDVARLEAGLSTCKAIAVEAAFGLDPETGRSDLFWFPKSGIADDRLFVYFDRPDTPASDSALTVVRRHCWRPLALRRDARSYLVRPHWGRALLLLLIGPFWLLEQSKRRGLAHWCWLCISESLGKVMNWQAVFADHNIRIHQNSGDLQGPYHLDQSVALEWKGSLNVHFTASFDYGPALKFGARVLPFDVLFVWGSYLASTFQKLDVAGITTLVSCGHPFDYLPEIARTSAADLRRDLKLAGAKRIICFFDSSFNEMCNTSLKDVEDIYRALLTEVIENPLLGLILKPKNHRELTALVTPEMELLLDKALTTGRCALFVRESSTDRRRSPCETALASDLAVGYPISSAIIEAVLAGVPGVHIDLTRHPDHWFYDVDYEKFVFNDLERAMDVIRRWVRDPADEPGLGDHSAVIDRLDPFRDGNAGRRVGQYMAWLLEGFDRGLGRDDVVRRATRLYAEKHGAQHVRLAPRLGHSQDV